MLRILIVLGVVFSTCQAIAQELIQMGTWRTHFNYEKAYRVESTTKKIFATTSNGLTIYDKEDNSLSKLSKVDGLSDSKISALTYVSSENQMILGYESGNIDLITSDGIVNYSVLVDSDVINDKSISHISFYAGNYNLATEFGLLVFEPEAEAIRNAYRNLGENGEVTPVFASTVFKDKMYLATSVGVLAGSLTSGDNLQDFNNWERYQSSLVYNLEILSIAQFDESIYALTAGDIFRLTGENWVNINSNPDQDFIKLRSSGEKLLVISNQKISELNEEGTLVDILDSENEYPVDAVYDNDGELWYADTAHGLSSSTNDAIQRFVLAGPLTNIVEHMKFDSDRLLVFPPLDRDTNNKTNNDLAYGYFNEGFWNEVVPEEVLNMDNISDVTTLSGQVYISSFGDGVLDSLNQVVFDETNSPLVRYGENVIVTGIAADDLGNIWMSNFSSLPLIKLDESGNFSSYDFLLQETESPTSIKINSYDQLWMTIGESTGMGVLSFDIATEDYRIINQSNSSLPSNNVNDIAFDLEGGIWFATDQGVAYFPYSYGIISDENADVLIPILDNNYLFLNEKINAITIDGGGRKWMATDNGAWLFDQDLNEVIYQFDADNSPLPSDEIIDIAVNLETGEVFFATGAGLVSFRSATSSATSKFSDVNIFPNPVVHNYQGEVGIEGLAFNASIRITTVSGKLVKAVNASGGSAKWNVTDYTGQRVKTGVYLVFSASENGSETFVGKIAVID